MEEERTASERACLGGGGGDEMGGEVAGKRKNEGEARDILHLRRVYFTGLIGWLWGEMGIVIMGATKQRGLLSLFVGNEWDLLDVGSCSVGGAWILGLTLFVTLFVKHPMMTFSHHSWNAIQSF